MGAYAISAGMRERAPLPAIGGMLLGYLGITIAVAAGVGAILTAIPVLLTALTLMGAGYLFYLGLRTFLNPPVPVAAKGENSPWSGWFVRGFGISGANPKALLLFLAILPQFTNPASIWPITGQITILGLVHIVNCAVIYSAVSLDSRAVLKSRPGIARLVGRASGIAMMVITLLLLAEQATTLASGI